MVAEISYEDYKRFCNLLPSKDFFYFVDNLFVCKNDNLSNIFNVKVKDYENTSRLESFFYELRENKEIIELSLEEFLKGFYSVESKGYIDDAFYRSKNFLVIF